MLKSRDFQDDVNALDVFVNNVLEKHTISFQELVSYMQESKRHLIPVSIINNRPLGALECIVKYLKEECKLSYHEIAILLNRNDRTIWNSYSSAQKKNNKRFYIKKSKYSIPVAILAERSHGILELIIEHLKEEEGLSYSNIARLLNRNPRTVWTSYERAKKKRINHG